MDLSGPRYEDPFDEKPLKYRKRGEKDFIVYSANPNGIDYGKKLNALSVLLYADREVLGFHYSICGAGSGP